jgi:hypothetical protein
MGKNLAPVLKRKEDSKKTLTENVDKGDERSMNSKIRAPRE